MPPFNYLAWIISMNYNINYIIENNYCKMNKCNAQLAYWVTGNSFKI